MLTSNETNDLLIKAKQGDDFAKEQLISMNSPLIKSIVRRYLNRGVEYDDLYQLGAIGFVKAINNFDITFNVKFTTYAVPMIAGEIKRFLRDDGSVKISRTIKHNAMLVKNCINNYIQLHGENPSMEYISKVLKMDQNDIVLAMDANSVPLSLNEQFNETDGANPVLDHIADDFSVDKFIDKLALREMIKTLTQREKQIIIMRYYLDKTQSDIAKELGVSQVQISRIENKVLQEMRENINSL